MKLAYCSLVCIICALLVISTGCSSIPNKVVNTSSGLIFHSSEVLGEQQGSVRQDSSGIIRMGEGYEKIELKSDIDKFN